MVSPSSHGSKVWQGLITKMVGYIRNSGNSLTENDGAEKCMDGRRACKGAWE